MRADNKEIFKTRFQKHYPRLCNIAYGYVSDKEDSEDIVQELFVYVWNKGLDSMAEPEFAAYMTTAVKKPQHFFFAQTHIQDGSDRLPQCFITEYLR